MQMDWVLWIAEREDDVLGKAWLGEEQGSRRLHLLTSLIRDGKHESKHTYEWSWGRVDIRPPVPFDWGAKGEIVVCNELLRRFPKDAWWPEESNEL